MADPLDPEVKIDEGKQSFKRHMFAANICGRCNKFPELNSCVHNGCSRCCVIECEKTNSLCPAHSVKKQKKDADAKLVESVLKKKSQKIKKQKKGLKRGTYIEEAIEALGDTVIIFSLRRYLGNPQFSQDHVESQKRSRRLSNNTDAIHKPHRLAKRKQFKSLADFIQSKKKNTL